MRLQDFEISSIKSAANHVERRIILPYMTTISNMPELPIILILYRHYISVASFPSYCQETLGMNRNKRIFLRNSCGLQK